MELLKIQMQMRSRSKDLSAFKLTLQLMKEKGIFGLYRGLGPTMARGNIWNNKSFSESD